MKTRMTLSLTLVCLGAAFLLSLVYSVTNPKIEADIRARIKINLMEVCFPDAKGIKQSEEDSTLWIAYDTLGEISGKRRFEEIIKDTLWGVFDTTGVQVGIAFKVFPRGYGGPIETFVGLANDTTVIGIRPAGPAEGLKETPGLGVKINEKWFKRQFMGKREKEILLKKDGGILDAITAATISSRAVADGVREGIEEHKKYLTSQN